MKKSDWGIEITKVGNGFSIKDNEGKIIVVEEVADDELSATEKLLWEIMEFFNLSGTKHDKERVRIVREQKPK